MRAKFGERLEARGDYKKAAEAFRSAGIHGKAERMGRKMAIVQDAKLLEKNLLYSRAAHLLLENGLTADAERFSERIKDEESTDACFAKGLVAVKTKKFEEANKYLEELGSRGPRQLCMVALLHAEAGSPLAKTIAHRLSGKKIADDTEDEEPAPKAMMMLKSPEDVSRVAAGMVSMLAWSMASESEMLYYALHIYQKLGNHIEARRCLVAMEETALDNAENLNYYLNGLMELDGKDAVASYEKNMNDAGLIIPEMHHTVAVIATFILAKHGVDALIANIERWKAGHEKAMESYGDVIYGDAPGRSTPEYLGINDLKALIAKRDEHRAVLVEEEDAKVSSFEASMSQITCYGDVEKLLDRLKELNMLIRTGDRIASAKEKYMYRIALAETAVKFVDDPAAQKFAGKTLARKGDTAIALECADMLFVLGEDNDAKSIILSCAEHLPNEKLRALANDYSEERPLLALKLYKKAKDLDGFVLQVRHILEVGSQEDVMQAAWAVSSAWQLDENSKQSFLMRDALARLEQFGEFGKKGANALRQEMTIKPLFQTTGFESVAS